MWTSKFPSLLAVAAWFLVLNMRAVDAMLGQGEEVTVVRTAEELQAAVGAGNPHIEVQEHLDLTTLGEHPRFFLQRLGHIPSTVRSIRVRCRRCWHHAEYPS